MGSSEFVPGKWQVHYVDAEGRKLEPATCASSFAAAVSFCRGWVSAREARDIMEPFPVPFRVVEPGFEGEVKAELNRLD